MKIDRVTYQKIFPTGMAYLNHKIGIEIQVDDNDNPDTVYEYAKQKVEQWNLESNPGMAVAMEYMKPDFYSHRNGDIGESNEQVVRNREDIIKAHIQTLIECKTLRNLEMFASMVQRENEPILFEAYNNKKKELQ